MSEKKVRSTVQIARTLIGHLPADLDDQLKVLVQRADNGQDTTVEVIDLLSQHKNIRLWMREQLNLQGGTKGDRGYGPLPGGPGPVTASKKWVCPEEECDRWFFVMQEEEDAPICEVHKVTMIHDDKKKG